MKPAYLGLLLAAAFVLAAASAAARRRRLPRELRVLAACAAAACAGGGFLLEARWELRGTLIAGLNTAQAAQAARLLTAPEYLDALDVPPEAAGILARSVHACADEGGARIEYLVRGFGRGGARAAAGAWIAGSRAEAAGIALAARLQCARTPEDVAAALAPPLPALGRPSRLVLRQILPELRDRLPAARAALDDFGRAIGEPERAWFPPRDPAGLLTPPAGADP